MTMRPSADGSTHVEDTHIQAPLQEARPAGTDAWRMPDEGERHARTWMSFGASKKIWGAALLEEARRNLALIAQTIARYEPVTVCVRDQERELARSYFKTLKNIEFLTCPLDDLWVRDHGPVFVSKSSGARGAVDFNFNGWGEKQAHANDANVAATIAASARVELLETDICLEGGGIEVDGKGTAIITESCVLNRNRNPGWSRRDCEQELQHLLGIRKVIWLPGVAGADITDGHTDFYARFASPGVVLAHLDPDEDSPEFDLTRRHLKILEAATDANGQRLRVITIEAPSDVREEFAGDDFCAGYINFYVCNGVVIAPEFGDRRTDEAARRTLAEVFPGRVIEQLNIDGIAGGGGGIHCATQQEPAA